LRRFAPCQTEIAASKARIAAHIAKDSPYMRVGIIATMKKGLEHFIYRELSFFNAAGLAISLFPTKFRPGLYNASAEWKLHRCTPQLKQNFGEGCYSCLSMLVHTIRGCDEFRGDGLFQPLPQQHGLAVTPCTSVYPLALSADGSEPPGEVE
jgi:hypothetical protein